MRVSLDDLGNDVRKARNIRRKLELTRESRVGDSNLEMNINNVAITFASRNRSGNEVVGVSARDRVEQRYRKRGCININILLKVARSPNASTIYIEMRIAGISTV